MTEESAKALPVLRVAAARKKFGDTPALQDASFELHDKEWLTLVGPNGAGKTTLIRAIVGRVALDDGAVTLLGESLNTRGGGNGAARRRLGFVPQEIALFPLLTARENLRTFAEFHEVAEGEIASKVSDALEWTGLEDHADRPIKTFSGGMKRRLNLACGTLHDPRILLLDEPTEGVDPQSRERIWEMLESLRASGASLLHTTHHLHEAEQICDRIIIIDKGQIIAEGTSAEIVQQTIGSKRTVLITLAPGTDPPPSVDGCLSITPIEHEPDRYRVGIDDLSRDLTRLMNQLSTAGCRVVDIDIKHPTLHAAFIQLTGRELRET